MTSQLDIDFPPLPTQAPPTVSQPPPPTPEQKIKSIYSNLVHKLTTLQTTFLLRSDSNTFWHKFLIPYLPFLLTPQRAESIVNFRRAFATAAQTQRLTQQNSTNKRYENFASALLWALDLAENSIYAIGEDAELRLMEAFSTIFHFVTRFCNEEWGLEITSGNSDQVLNITGEVPSTSDPIYHPRTVRRLKSVKEQCVESVQHESIESHQKRFPRSFSMLFPSNSHYMRREGKVVTPFACIRQSFKKCLVPFQLAVKEKSNIDDDLNLPSKYAEIRYRDNTFYDFIPMQNVRLIYQKVSRQLSADRKACLEEREVGCVVVDGLVYDTMINISKKAYTKGHPGSKPSFFTDAKLPLPKQNMEIRIPVMPSCYVRVMDAQRFRECPIWEAFEMCQHDLCGYALFQVEFLEQVDGTRILTPLLGMIVEKKLSNCGDAIFDFLDPRRGKRKEVGQVC